jgi:hypothetical protein
MAAACRHRLHQAAGRVVFECGATPVTHLAADPTLSSSVDLYWLPLGAGGRVVPRCGRAFERLSAARERRSAQPLFHSALEVARRGTRYVIEMAPAWSSSDPGRGVAAVGPVGLVPLGQLRLFRYEVRCWPEGQIPDVAWAVQSPRRLSDDDVVAARVLSQVSKVPTLTWGRDELGLGDMWNSNSLVAWLLATCGLGGVRLTPPGNGRAPGWSAGLALAGVSAAGAQRRAP